MSLREDREQTLTGRIQAGPSALVHDEVLAAQFDYELRYLLRWYILIERVLLLEYERMGLLEREAVIDIGTVLGRVTREAITADPEVNMSDIAFAIEQYVACRLQGAVGAWHVDRSRNDFQACAQFLFGRDQLFGIVDDLSAFFRAVHRSARNVTEMVMPGYTQYQPAQVISPGFYLAALSEQALSTLRSLLETYDGINVCPLGAGAMAGQELPWDRARMAKLLGCRAPQRHALVAVASREWLLRIAGELSILSVSLSRFVTDLIYWASGECRFIDLPDELSGISSVMPQKKNFPILERIRGRTGHVSAFYVDFLLGQRNTPYTNLVEVSKEAGSHLITLFTAMQSVLRLFTVTIEHMRFQEDRMRAACEREYLGGLTLANLLTLHEGIPYRTSQVIIGRYIVAAMKRQLEPRNIDRSLLKLACQQYGYDVHLSNEMFNFAFDVDQNLRAKTSLGSTQPHAVRQLLTLQAEEMNRVCSKWKRRRADVEDTYRRLNSLTGGK